MKQILLRLGTGNLPRFLLVGGAATGMDFVLYMVLGVWISNLWAKLISMGCACAFSFFCNRSWTFRDDSSLKISTVVRYVLSQLVNIGVNVSVNSLCYGLSGSRIFSFAVATATAMTVNYLLQKWVVFCGRKDERGGGR